ncbi:MAG TPA: ATP-binding protein [Elusimicrobiales bacterium]|nr:ATP-binding protein [Elusimicrobiales bacterium]
MADEKAAVHGSGRESIEETGAYFRLIAENLTDMVALVDASGRRLYCTPNYRFLDDPSRLPGTDSFNEIHPEDRERIKNIFFETVRTGKGRSTQYRMVLKDGSVRRIQSQGVAIKGPDGSVSKVLVVSRDVTEMNAAAERQKALEAQLFQAEKLSALGKTISGVAHELNNPLTGIMGFCQLLLRDDSIQNNSRHREDVITIFKEAERCQKIVRDLTTFARKHKPEKKPLGVNGLLEDSINLQEYQMSTHGVKVEKDLCPDLPKIMADRHQLQQVFVNLMVNAQDAMRPVSGGKTLSVRTRKTDGTIRVEITDNGPGIPEENLSRIFEPFFTTKEVGKGTGLGLSLSYGIVSEHGGRIWAENVPGGGARFCVEIPITDVRDIPAGKGEGRAGVFREGQRILIVDDEEQIIKLVVRACGLLNLSSDTARDPATARRKIAAGNYDCVLCDYRLPGQNGAELFQWAVAARPELKKAWVLMTGSTGSDDLDDICCPVLKKPFSLEALEEALGSVLKRA